MEILKKHKSKLIILFAIILIIVLSIVLIRINPINIVQNIAKNMDEEKLSYEIYGVENGSIKIVVKFSDNENGIDTIYYPDGTELKCNNKKNIAIDYNIDDYEKGTTREILFKIINSNNEEFQEKVVINDEIINNLIPVSADVDDTYVYVDIDYAEETVEKNYKIAGVSEQYSNYSGKIQINPLNVSSISEDKKIEINIRQKHRSGNIIEITKEIDVGNLADSYTRDEGLVGKVAQISNSGYEEVEINANTSSVLIPKNVKYNIHTIVYEGDLTLDGVTNVEGATLENNIYEFGDNTTDVATGSTYAQNMVVLKVNGNLTINEGVTLTSCKSDSGYGGPKGMMVYCTGTITNNGTISMTERGAKAKGENVYLVKEKDNDYQYIPAIGATGGAARSLPSYTAINGNKGNDGINRQTGGGGTGAGRSWSSNCAISAGGTGTSYSGGSGSGAANSDGAWGWYVVSGGGSSEGGAGGNGVVGSSNGSGYGQLSIGGTGNPSGGYANYRVTPVNYVKREGTGGLLIIYSQNIINNAQIEANGVSSSTTGRSFTYSRVDTGGASRRRKC